jgi:hypothetical protein
MKRSVAVAIAFGVTFGASGLALAQPAYGPNAATYYAPGYPGYAAPPAVVAPPPLTAYPQGYSEPHTGGGTSRAYSYWGAQKTN